MPEREQKRKQAPEREGTAEQDVTVAAADAEKLKSDLDDLLDEIDDVLETNAEDFVKSYVQKGGQ